VNVEKCIRRGGKASAMPAQRVEPQQVRDQVEKGKMRGESRAVVLNAAKLGKFGMDELRGW
jgi:hypothetical protein